MQHLETENPAFINNLHRSQINNKKFSDDARLQSILLGQKVDLLLYPVLLLSQPKVLGELLS